MSEFSFKGPVYMLWLVLLFFIVVITLVFKIQNIEFNIDSLQGETRFLVLVRKMLGSADCLAFEEKNVAVLGEPDYNVYYRQRTYPGLLDAYKLENWANQQCVQQDDPEVGIRAYEPLERPIIMYSVLVTDLENDNKWFFTKTHDRSYFISAHPDPDDPKYRGVPCMWAAPCNASLGDQVYQYSYPVYVMYQDKKTGEQVKHLARFNAKFCRASASPKIIGATVQYGLCEGCESSCENCPENNLCVPLLFGFYYCGETQENPDNFRWDMYDCVQYHTAEELGEAETFEVSVE